MLNTEAKSKIQSLIEKYEKAKNTGQTKIGVLIISNGKLLLIKEKRGREAGFLSD